MARGQKICFILLTLFIIHCLPYAVSSTSNRRSPVIFNFGDSNSDTGGFTAAYGLEAGYPYGRAFFRRPTGRQSDGRLVIDFLCEYLDTHYLTPYLDSMEPNFTKGVNFAIGGACILPSPIPFNLGVQVLQLKHFYNRVLDLLRKGESGITNLVRKEDFEDALYTFDIGQNDLSGSFGALPYDQVRDRIPSFILGMKDAISAIYQLGGRNFWVHNTGPLGCLPQELAIRNNLSVSDYDQYGCINSLNEGAKAFNNKLKALCEELQSQLKNSTIVYVDMYSIKYDLIANSTSYGFKNPLMACCGYGGPPYNYNVERNCLAGGYSICEKTTPYISWDGTHYAEAANAIVASKVLSTRYSSPPLKLEFFSDSVNLDEVKHFT